MLVAIPRWNAAGLCIGALLLCQGLCVAQAGVAMDSLARPPRLLEEALAEESAAGLLRLSSNALVLAFPVQKLGRPVTLQGFLRDGLPIATTELRWTKTGPRTFLLESEAGAGAAWTFRLSDEAPVFVIHDDTAEDKPKYALPGQAGDLPDDVILLRAREPLVTESPARELPLVLGSNGYVLAVQADEGGQVLQSYEPGTHELTMFAYGSRLRVSILFTPSLAAVLPTLPQALPWLTWPQRWSIEQAAANAERADAARLLTPALAASLEPYLAAAAPHIQNVESGIRPIAFDLDPSRQHTPPVEATDDVYALGSQMVGAPSHDRNGPEHVFLPNGTWVNFWTGVQAIGGTPVTNDLTDSLPALWVRAGTVLPRASTAPFAESTTADKDLAVYEVYPGEPGIQDIPGSSLPVPAIVRGGQSVTLSHGEASAVHVRWRFVHIRNPALNGKALQLQHDPDGSDAVDFVYAGDAVLTWSSATAF